MQERCGLARRAVCGRREVTVEGLRLGYLSQSCAATLISLCEEDGRKATTTPSRESRGVSGRPATIGRRLGQAPAIGSQGGPIGAPTDRGLRRGEDAGKQTASSGKVTATVRRPRSRLRRVAATVLATGQTEGRPASTAIAVFVILDGGRGQVSAAVSVSASVDAIGQTALTFKAN